MQFKDLLLPRLTIRTAVSPVSQAAVAASGMVAVVATVQAPFTQEEAGLVHALPQRPQLARVFNGVSQPLASLPSQLPNPGRKEGLEGG